MKNNRMKWFTSQKMSWGKVLLLAAATAVVTAVLKLIPFLDDTSFQDIAINLECWILFAVFIIVNCTKWYEAAAKTFVFFLISQPLIYLIQVPFSPLGFQLFGYYRYWFIVTLLTLPGSVIAFQVRRRDWLSVAVLSVATVFLAYLAAYYFWDVRTGFPHHVLSLCFCIALAFFLVFTLLDRRAHRIAAVVLILAALAVSLPLLKPVDTQTLLPGDGSWTYTVDGASVAGITAEPDGAFRVTAARDGISTVTFTNERGEVKEYMVTVSGGGIFINEIE